MKLEGDYVFEAPLEIVWEALLDPEVLASVLPGCEKLELDEDGQYTGQLKVKVGPVQGKFKGKVGLSNIEPLQGYDMKIDGRGTPGFVKADARVDLEAAEAGTLIRYSADAKVGGKIASVGQRLVDAAARAIAAESLDGLHAQVKAKAAEAGAEQARAEAESAAKAAEEAAAQAEADAAAVERAETEARAKAEAAAKAAEEAAAVEAPKQKTEAEFAAAVAREVSDELMPAGVRYAVAVLAGILFGWVLRGMAG